VTIAFINKPLKPACKYFY